MKFTFIETQEKEEVVVYGKTKTKLACDIEALCSSDALPLIGYENDNFRELNPEEVECFIVLEDKVYAITNKKMYLVKKRLYELSEEYQNTFIYINQSCLGNLKLVEKFDVNIGGALQVVFKSGYKDYVSRRKLKSVKERLGLK